MRHFGAYEAYSSIMGKPLAKIFPPVEVLGIHLENEETLIHTEGNEERAVENRKDTHLIAWVKLNERNGSHRGKLYKDVVKYYKFSSDHRWVRSDRHILGRLMPVTLTVFNSELFHLRLLLCNKTDVTSFAAIRTVEGREYDTYKEACVKLNLVQDEGELALVMEELAEMEFPGMFRRTFALMLLNINPIEPRKLWDDFCERMCDDFLHEGLSRNEAEYARLS